MMYCDKIVPQKHLTGNYYWGTLNTSEVAMANVLNTDKQVAVIAALADLLEACQ